MRHSIALKDIIIDPNEEISLTNLSELNTIALLVQAYAFLSKTLAVRIESGYVIIEMPDAEERQMKKAIDGYNEAVKLAELGKYNKAIQLFFKVLDVLPFHIDARRNLAMANMEIGKYTEAKKHLAEVLRLDPKEAWAFLLLGNIYAKKDKDLEKAEKFYLKSYENNPQDSYLLNNYAALMADKQKYSDAEKLFSEAIQINPKYPNSYYGLALAYYKEGRIELALASLADLFDKASDEDIRSSSVYAGARELFYEANVKIADKNLDMMTSFIEDRRVTLESASQYKIKIIEDNSIEMVHARTQMAWKYKREFHEIRYKKIIPIITPHLLTHEMQHIHLENEARKIGRNRVFISTAETREHAIKSIGDHVYKLKSFGYSDDSVTELILKFVGGLANQLFNAPLDMIIEKQIYAQYDIIRSSQFVSLSNTSKESLSAFTNREIKKLTPDIIYKANISMNVAFALCIDSFYKGSTDYAIPYKNSNYFEIGSKLFQAWQNAEKNFKAGDEYLLVDEFAHILKLQNWYKWLPDESADIEREGTTNPELLKQKEPATVMYLLAALQRYENMNLEEIQKITFEIGLLGQTGIDYTKSDRRYSLQSIPQEQFTGLQLLALMYVGFQKIDPSVDLKIDFKDAYQAALFLYNKPS